MIQFRASKIGKIHLNVIESTLEWIHRAKSWNCNYVSAGARINILFRSAIRIILPTLQNGPGL